VHPTDIRENAKMQKLVLFAIFAMIVIGRALPTEAEDRVFNLIVDDGLQNSGLMKHLLPRFTLKTSIKINVATAQSAELESGVGLNGVQVVIVGKGLANHLRIGKSTSDAAFRSVSTDNTEEKVYSVVLVEGDENPSAQVFVNWLLSDIGQGTIEAYKVDGVSLFSPVTREMSDPVVEMPEGDVGEGEKLALLHCGRCHVVNEKNRMGGIGSTPSFAAMRAIPGWQDKFMAFWAVNPHPSFTQVEGLTRPFDPNKPPHIAPLEITQKEMDAILAFAATVTPKDLGAAIQSR